MTYDRKGGRPPSLTEKWTRITVILLNRHVAFLDRFASDIRLETAHGVKRSEILRHTIEIMAQDEGLRERIVQAVMEERGRVGK